MAQYLAQMFVSQLSISFLTRSLACSLPSSSSSSSSRSSSSRSSSRSSSSSSSNIDSSSSSHAFSTSLHDSLAGNRRLLLPGLPKGSEETFVDPPVKPCVDCWLSIRK
eukprot:scaffold127178_cov17-Tisochrysis_lutea.AAC.1